MLKPKSKFSTRNHAPEGTVELINKGKQEMKADEMVQ